MTPALVDGQGSDTRKAGRAIGEVTDPHGILDSVLSEVDVAPNTGDVWIGGQCGRMWRKPFAGGWVEVKSGTDAHVVGLSFVPEGAGARGFVGAFRDSDTQQCITSVQ